MLFFLYEKSLHHPDGKLKSKIIKAEIRSSISSHTNNPFESSFYEPGRKTPESVFQVADSLSAENGRLFSDLPDKDLFYSNLYDFTTKIIPSEDYIISLYGRGIIPFY